MIESVMAMALDVLSWILAWVARIFTASGSLVYWMALFAAFTVARLFLRPIIGDALHAPAQEAVDKLRKARAAKQNADNSGGND